MTTDDETMRGFIAAALLMGDPIPADKLEEYDPLYDYCERFNGSRFGPNNRMLFNYAEDLGYIIVDETGDWYSITEKGKEFFVNANIQVGVLIPPGGVDDET